VRENRALPLRIKVRVQPTQKKGHIPPELVATRIGPHTEHPVAVSLWMEQHLLNKEGRGLAHRLAGPARRFAGLACQFFITSGDVKQIRYAVWKRRGPHEPHLGGHMEKVNRQHHCRGMVHREFSPVVASR